MWFLPVPIPKACAMSAPRKPEISARALFEGATVAPRQGCARIVFSGKRGLPFGRSLEALAIRSHARQRARIDIGYTMLVVQRLAAIVYL